MSTQAPTMFVSQYSKKKPTLLAQQTGKKKKKIPAGKKGKGIRALKKKAPQVAKRMGYKKGMRACG